MGRSTRMERLRHAALEWVDLLGVGVVPGHHLEYDPLGWRCSCGVDGCPLPGAHPRCVDWMRQAAFDPAWLVGWWSDPRWPCSVLSPIGLRFDVLEVAGATGELALTYLRQWAVPLGPVLRHRDRVSYLVESSSRVDLAEVAIRDHAGAPGRGLVCRTDGHLVVPPSNVGTPGLAEWLVPPSAAHRSRLPEAGELLGAVGYAEQVLAGTRDRDLSRAVGF